MKKKMNKLIGSFDPKTKKIIPFSKKEEDEIINSAKIRFRNAKNTLGKFDINKFLKAIKIHPDKNTSNDSSYDIEQFIGEACDIHKDDYITNGFYVSSHPKDDGSDNTIPLINIDDLRDGIIFHKLDKSFTFVPIANGIGYIDGLEPYQAILGYLYSTKSKYSYFTFFDDCDGYYHFYFVKKVASNKPKNSTFFKNFLKEFIYSNIFFYGVVDGNMKYILLNKSLNWKLPELKKIFKKALKIRRLLNNDYLEEVGDPKGIYDLPIFFLKQNNFLLFPNEGLFNRTPKFIKSKLKKPSIVLKV